MSSSTLGARLPQLVSRPQQPAVIRSRLLQAVHFLVIPLASSAHQPTTGALQMELAWPMLIIPATILFQLLKIAHLVACLLAQLALLFTIGASHLFQHV